MAFEPLERINVKTETYYDIKMNLHGIEYSDENSLALV
jgi:hypothetical protein